MRSLTIISCMGLLISALARADVYLSTTSNERIVTTFHENRSVFIVEYCRYERCFPMGAGEYSIDNLVRQEVSAYGRGLYQRRVRRRWLKGAAFGVITSAVSVPFAYFVTPELLPLLVSSATLNLLGGGVFALSKAKGPVSLSTVLLSGQKRVAQKGEYPELLKILRSKDTFKVEGFQRFKQELEALLLQI